MSVTLPSTHRPKGCGFFVRDASLRTTIGTKYGRLEVLGKQFRIRKKWYVVVQCECGGVMAVRILALEHDNTASCGCLKRETAPRNAITKHGLTGTPLYDKWHVMKLRCHNPNDPAFHRYGGRGISVCDEWRYSFEAFRDWAYSSGWVLGLTIERRNPNGNYEPSNCTWIPHAKQARNRRNTRWLTIQGVRKPITEWLEEPGAVSDRHVVYNRLDRGASPEEAVFAKDWRQSK